MQDLPRSLEFSLANLETKDIFKSKMRLIFEGATNRHNHNESYASEHQKNDIGYVGLMRRTASKLCKDQNRKNDPTTLCVHGRPRQHVQ